MANKRTYIVYFVLIALNFCLLFSSCNNDERFPGQKTVTYDVNAADKPMVINILENDKRYLSCVVTLDITNKADIKLLSEKNHWIRDTVIEICRSKNLEELQSADIMEELGKDIAEAISEQFSINSIYKVSFPTFYLN